MTIKKFISLQSLKKKKYNPKKISTTKIPIVKLKKKKIKPSQPILSKSNNLTL